MTTQHYTKNTTIFYAPIWIENYKDFVNVLNKDSRFESIKKEKAPTYLLPYATDLYHNDDLFEVFSVKKEFLPSMCMFKEKLGFDTSPVLESLHISCFDTGCAFAEFFVTYDGLDLSQIADFSYYFKNAVKCDKDNGYTKTMQVVLKELLSEAKSIEMFFTGSDFKKECRVFHHLFSEADLESEKVKNQLSCLSRGYHKNFNASKSDSNYDMTYMPYSNDCWAGSQEGLVNLFGLSGEESTDNFIKKYKRTQLECNYAFMYLLLLNQRYTAIKLISKISRYNDYSEIEREEINKRITQLKTTYSFNVISDDRLYQNVYMRMYALLDIDRLLADIRENEEYSESMRSREALKAEKETSYLLLLLSILSLFSVLTDAASYFERIPFVEGISTIMSLVMTVFVITVYIMWVIRQRRK